MMHKFLTSIPILYQTASYLLLAALLTQCNSSPEYSAELSFSQKSITKFDYERIDIPLTVKNTGSASWDSFAASGPVSVSYHVLSKTDGSILKFDNIRTPFLKKISPGKSTSVSLYVEPLAAGEYLIQADLITENITWFERQGSKSIKIPLTVVESTTQIAKPPLELKAPLDKVTWYIEGENEINYCSLVSASTIMSNLKQFKFQNSTLFGFDAGSVYPQVWIRDSAAIMPVARYAQQLSSSISWFKAHLTIQKESGELQDWIKYDGTFGKNTTESDQESNLIIAAYEIAKTHGYDWLLSDVKSRSIILRLHDALNFLFTKRHDHRTGLIKSGHTADWGDVSNEFSDQRAVDLYTDSNEVVGIYTNALAYGAATKLSFLSSKTGDDSLSRYWKTKSEELYKNIQRYLWQEDRGFFRIHIHINNQKHTNFNEANILPMGGNAVAIEMGVATPWQTKKIISQALYRQKVFNFSTISGVLLPPYPIDFFQNKILNNYFEYQNGGQWDWYGGILVLQMFHVKHPDAIIKLREICQKTFINKGFYEWNTMDGAGKGSPHYTASAAAISRAAIEGLFGINWDYRSIQIKPSLSINSGYIHIPDLSNDHYFSYVFNKSHKPDSKLNIKFSYGTDINYSKTLSFPYIYQDYHFSWARLNKETFNVRSVNNEVKIDLPIGKNDIYVEYQQAR